MTHPVKTSVGARPIPFENTGPAGKGSSDTPKLLQDESVFFISLACKVKSYLGNQERTFALNSL